MKPEFSILKMAIEDYQQAVEVVEQKRVLWHTQVENFIFDTLTAIKGELPFACSVRKVEHIQNLENIEFSFDEKPSGISQATTEGVKDFQKIGAKLIFTQSYSGQILVLYLLPFIKDLMPQPQPEVIGEAQPEIIDTAFVLDKVRIFLEKTTKWEGSDRVHKQNPIGFYNK